MGPHKYTGHYASSAGGLEADLSFIRVDQNGYFCVHLLQAIGDYLRIFFSTLVYFKKCCRKCLLFSFSPNIFFIPLIFEGQNIRHFKWECSLEINKANEPSAFLWKKGEKNKDEETCGPWMQIMHANTANKISSSETPPLTLCLLLLRPTSIASSSLMNASSLVETHPHLRLFPHALLFLRYSASASVGPTPTRLQLFFRDFLTFLSFFFHLLPSFARSRVTVTNQ
jgi:hypothetical protein